VRASCWKLLKPLPCDHIWHTCWPGYSQQTYQTHNHFKWSVHGHACPL
jgi:hypothetical protein